MSHWLPKLEAAGLPVPCTRMVPMSQEAYRDMFRVFDGMRPAGPALPFLEKLRAAAEEIGCPVFLRTGMTSAKHSWSRTCALTDLEHLVSHVAAIIEFSECASFIGLACDWWAIREMLPTVALAVCPRYDGMPVCREFRCFVSDGDVRCVHPYWPPEALVRGGAERAEEIAAMLACCPDEPTIRRLASRAGAAVGGEWSVDVLETRRGWYVTDMAEAAKSWHWPGCAAAMGAHRVESAHPESASG